MEFITISAEQRQIAKKRGAKAVRSKGHIPAIVYGKGREPMAVSVDAKTFNQHLGKGGRLFHLEVGGNVESTMLKDLQWDTFGVNILHADFSRVAEGDRIVVHTPIRLTHVSQIDLEGGTLMIDMHSVSIEAQVTAIPDEIVLDVADLVLGKPKTVGDLVLPDAATVRVPASDLVVHIRERLLVEETPAEVEGEAAEGADAPTEGDGQSKPSGEGGPSV